MPPYRRARTLAARLFVASTLLVALPSYGVSQGTDPVGESRAELARAIRQVVEELHAARRERLRVDGQHAEELAVLERQVQRLEDELQSLEAVTRSQVEERAQLEKRIADENRAAASARAWVEVATDIARPIAQRARQRVDRAAGPQRLRRAGGFGNAARLLGQGDASQRVKGLRELFRAFGEEWLPARSVTLSNEPVLLSGGEQSKHAWVVGFGFVTRLFVSEDETMSGLWSNDPNDPWRLDVPDGTGRQIRDLLDIVRERQPPTISPAPVLISK